MSDQSNEQAESCHGDGGQPLSHGSLSGVASEGEQNHLSDCNIKL